MIFLIFFSIFFLVFDLVFTPPATCSLPTTPCRAVTLMWEMEILLQHESLGKYRNWSPRSLHSFAVLLMVSQLWSSVLTWSRQQWAVLHHRKRYGLDFVEVAFDLWISIVCLSLVAGLPLIFNIDTFFFAKHLLAYVPAWQNSISVWSLILFWILFLNEFDHAWRWMMIEYLMNSTPRCSFVVLK